MTIRRKFSERKGRNERCKLPVDKNQWQVGYFHSQEKVFAPRYNRFDDGFMLGLTALYYLA